MKALCLFVSMACALVAHANDAYKVSVTTQLASGYVLPNGRTIFDGLLMQVIANVTHADSCLFGNLNASFGQANTLGEQYLWTLGCGVSHGKWQLAIKLRSFDFGATPLFNDDVTAYESTAQYGNWLLLHRHLQARDGINGNETELAYQAKFWRVGVRAGDDAFLGTSFVVTRASMTKRLGEKGFAKAELYYRLSGDQKHQPNWLLNVGYRIQ